MKYLPLLLIAACGSSPIQTEESELVQTSAALSPVYKGTPNMECMSEDCAWLRRDDRLEHISGMSTWAPADATSVVELNGALWVSTLQGERFINLDTGEITELPGKGSQAVRSGDRLFVLIGDIGSFTVEARSLSDLHVEWQRTFEVMVSIRITLRHRLIISADSASLFVVHPWWNVFELMLDGQEIRQTRLADHGEDALGGWAGNLLIDSAKQIGGCVDKVVPLTKKNRVACINESGEVAVVDSKTGKAITRTLFDQEVRGLFRTATGVRVLTATETEIQLFDL